MQNKSDPSYLRSLKTYRENRVGVLQTSKKNITPALLTRTSTVKNRHSQRHNGIKSYGDSSKLSNENLFSNNSSSNIKINEAVAEYRIQSYALNNRLFVESLQEDNSNFQSSDRPPLVRYSHLPNTLKYERISVPRGVLDKPGSFENCMPAENIIEPSLAAAAHCTHGWIAPRARKKIKEKKLVDKGGRTFSDFDIRSAMSEINYEEQILNHVNEGINKSTLRGMLIVVDDQNRYKDNNESNNNEYMSPYKTKSYTENEYADGVLNQPRSWGVGRNEYYNHFSSATKTLLKREEEVRKPVLRRVKMY